MGYNTLPNNYQNRRYLVGIVYPVASMGYITPDADRPTPRVRIRRVFSRAPKIAKNDAGRVTP